MLVGLVNRNTVVVMLIVLLFQLPLSATTVIVMTSPHGMVIGTDSQFSHHATTENGTGTHAKFVIVQGRIVIVNVQTSHFEIDTGYEYSFLTWIKNLQPSLPNNVSVDDFVGIIEKESAPIWQNWATVLKSGTYKPKSASQPCDLIVQYVIAGYQGGIPTLYVVQFYIDWNKGEFIGPRKIRLEPRSYAAGNFGVDFFGITDAAADFLNGQSYAYKQTLARCPKALGDLLAHRDVSLDETVALTRSLIKVEEDTNPSSVGGKIRIAEILPDGRAHEEMDVLPKAKTRTGQKQN